jgi:hypothetical protein
LLGNSRHFRSRISIIRDKDVFDFYGNFTDGSNRALLVHTEVFKHYQNLAAIDNKSNFVVLKQKVISDFAGIFMEINNYMFDVLNDKVTQLVESGIIDKFLKTSNPPQDRNDPIVLSLEHLQTWFILWLGILLLAGFFFFAEVLFSKAQKYLKRNQVETLNIQFQT